MKNNSVKLSLVAVALCASFGAQAQTRPTNSDGYLTDTWGHVVKSGTGLCVRTSSYNPATTFHPECDPVAPQQAVVVPEAPRVQPPQTVVVPPVITAKNLSAEVLFNFDSDKLTAAGKQQLDALTRELTRSVDVDHVVINGYTDPIGTNAYNMGLSERRAIAVQQYLSSIISRELVQINAKGESNLKVTTCGDRKTAKSIACNAPNRRVEVFINATDRK